MCNILPQPKDPQHIVTHVRQSETKHIPIANKTNQTWNLKPIIDGEYWSGPVTFMVEANQTKQYTLMYKPLTMTPEGKKHLVSMISISHNVSLDTLTYYIPLLIFA